MGSNYWAHLSMFVTCKIFIKYLEYVFLLNIASGCFLLRIFEEILDGQVGRMHVHVETHLHEPRVHAWVHVHSLACAYTCCCHGIDHSSTNMLSFLISYWSFCWFLHKICILRFNWQEMLFLSFPFYFRWKFVELLVISSAHSSPPFYHNCYWCCSCFFFRCNWDSPAPLKQKLL